MVIVKTWYFEHPCFLDRELYIWDCLGNLIRSSENTTEIWAVTDQPLWCIEEPSSVCITVSYPEPPRDEGRESTRRPQGRRWLHCACGIQSHACPHNTRPVDSPSLALGGICWAVTDEPAYVHMAWTSSLYVKWRKSVSYGLTMLTSDGPPRNLNQPAPLILLFEVKHSARMDSQCTR